MRVGVGVKVQRGVLKWGGVIRRCAGMLTCGWGKGGSLGEERGGCGESRGGGVAIVSRVCVE